MRPKIGITIGDVNGIGVEVIVKALSNPDIKEILTPVIFGNSAILKQVAADLAAEELHLNVVPSAAEAADGKINLVETGEAGLQRMPGMKSAEAGKAAVAALEAGVKAAQEGHIDALVTAPIDKETAQSDDFHFVGHTEFLEDRFAADGEKALMVLADGGLRVALVTTHVPLHDVSKLVTRERVEDAIKRYNQVLKMDFGCERPKIAVLSLNPHCGDGGVIGREEEEQIIPAIEECQRAGILAFGPIAADGLFGSGAYMNFDGILAMYHDQGLAPFKALTRSGGTNFTAGLQVVRTSPAHGTAYDKAGKGSADEASLKDAIYSAIDILRRRQRFLEAAANPLHIREKVQKEGRRPRPGETPTEPDAKDLAAAE